MPPKPMCSDAIAEGHFHGSGTLGQVEGCCGEKLDFCCHMSLMKEILVELKAHARKCGREVRFEIWNFFSPLGAFQTDWVAFFSLRKSHSLQALRSKGDEVTFKEPFMRHRQKVLEHRAQSPRRWR